MLAQARDVRQDLAAQLIHRPSFLHHLQRVLAALLRAG